MRGKQAMAKPESVFIYVGTYVDKAAAGDDYQVIKDLHSAGAVGTYDAAVVTKDYNGKVHVNKDEMATRHVPGAARRSARWSVCCSRPRSSAPPPWARPSAASAGTCGAACPAPTSRSSARSSTRARPRWWWWGRARSSRRWSRPL